MAQNTEHYRREVKELIESTLMSRGLTIEDLANQMSVTIASVSRWKNGRVLPRRKQFDRLKALASGTLSQPVAQSQPDVLSQINGRLEQLTLQVAHLQSHCGRLEGRIETLEGQPLKKTVPAGSGQSETKKRS